MKYPARTYAQALVEVLEAAKAGKAKQEEIGKNFIALIKKNGDEAHVGKILDEASRLSRAKSGIRKVAIESARTLTASQRKSFNHFLKEDDVVEEHVDPEIIAGVRIIVNDEMQLDGSLKAKLNQLLPF